MARKRKTVDVTDLRIRINDMLRLSQCNREVRRGMIAVLEGVLHDTGNYKGFRYLESHEVPDGELPGIIRANTELRADGPNTENEYPDDTRVEYYG